MTYLLDNPGLVHNKAVVEVGAGCGLPGIGLALHGNPRSVLLTDRPELCQLLEVNVSANFGRATSQCSKARPRAEPLLWNNPEHLKVVLQSGPFDLIIGSDLAYDEDFHAALLTTLKALAGSRAHIVLAIPRRDGEDDAFLKLSITYGWQFQQTKVYDYADVDPEASAVRILESGPPNNVAMSC